MLRECGASDKRKRFGTNIYIVIYWITRIRG